MKVAATPSFSRAATIRTVPGTSIYEASERDFRIVLVSDAISGWYDRGGEKCQEWEGIGVHVGDLSDTMDWLAR